MRPPQRLHDLGELLTCPSVSSSRKQGFLSGSCEGFLGTAGLSGLSFVLVSKGPGHMHSRHLHGHSQHTLMQGRETFNTQAQGEQSQG